MPNSSVAGLGRGFLRLDRSGPRLVMIVDVVPSVIVEPFDTEVICVVTEPILPAYGLPEEAVIAIPLSKTAKARVIIYFRENAIQLTVLALPVSRIVVRDCSRPANVRHLGGISAGTS